MITLEQMLNGHSGAYIFLKQTLKPLCSGRFAQDLLTTMPPVDCRRFCLRIPHTLRAATVQAITFCNWQPVAITIPNMQQLQMNMTSTFDRINGGFGRIRVLIRFDHEDLLMRVN
jgi:hypothetical protein